MFWPDVPLKVGAGVSTINITWKCRLSWAPPWTCWFRTCILTTSLDLWAQPTWGVLLKPAFGLLDPPVTSWLFSGWCWGEDTPSQSPRTQIFSQEAVPCKEVNVLYQTGVEAIVWLLFYRLRKIIENYWRSLLSISKVLTKSHVSSYLCYTILSGISEKPQKEKEKAPLKLGNVVLTIGPIIKNVLYYFSFLSFFLVFFSPQQSIRVKSQCLLIPWSISLHSIFPLLGSLPASGCGCLLFPFSYFGVQREYAYTFSVMERNPRIHFSKEHWNFTF